MSSQPARLPGCTRAEQNKARKKAQALDVQPSPPLPWRGFGVGEPWVPAPTRGHPVRQHNYSILCYGNARLAGCGSALASRPTSSTEKKTQKNRKKENQKPLKKTNNDVLGKRITPLGHELQRRNKAWPRHLWPQGQGMVHGSVLFSSTGTATSPGGFLAS